MHLCTAVFAFEPQMELLENEILRAAVSAAAACAAGE